MSQQENGHHELMDQMDTVGGSQREDDYLAGVSELAEVAAQAAGEPAAETSAPVGQRVRQVRESKGLTLTDLAQRTGLSEEELTAIEDGRSNPPLGVLVRLGKALDMRLGTLIATGEDRPYTVVRVAERQDMSRYPHTRQTSYGYSYQALAPKKRNRSMEPFLVTLTGASQDVAPSTHDGEEFIYVLEGEMEALVGEAREVLGPGDCIYYDSTVPHLVRPHGQGPTLILAVIYSPQR
jgi:transcriptional regulator with XRE-family HTH domain